MACLRADIFVAPPTAWKKPDGTQGGLWSPCSCALIHGVSEAVLVDTAITNSQNKDLADWIEQRIPQKRLTTIYITHGHADQFLGIDLLLKRFPGAQAVSRAVLWVPDLRLAACGDVVYGDVHRMLGEDDTEEKRLAWIKSIRKVEALQPELVVPGHMKASEMPGSFHLAATRQYIEDFNVFIDSGAKNAHDLSSLMLKKYPTRYNPSALVLGAWLLSNAV